MELANKSVIITGASRGIGAAIAKDFAARGAKLVLTARSTEVNSVAEKLRQNGVEVEVAVGDVTDDAHVRAVVLLARSKFKQVDVIVNNAGILTSAKLGMMKMEEARRMFEVNVLATINFSQYAVRTFPRASGGSIINIASIAGTQGIDGLSAYSASKAAVIGFTKSAAKELAPLKIRVNSIAPGFIDTDMARQVSPEWFQRRVEGIRIGRIGQPADIAACAAFLASDASSYVTGQILGVDGGMIV